MTGRLRSALLVSALTAPMPAPPVRNFSFTDWQVAHPTEPPPGDKLDSNFDNTNAAVAAQLTWASVSLNSDGTIRDGIIDANNLVPGLFDDVSNDIIATVQPLVDEAQSYAQSAQTSALNAEAEATSAAAQAANAAGAATAANVAAAGAEGSETAAQISETAAVNAKTAAENAANDAMGSEDQAELFADLAGAWAEHMPDTIPPEVLAVNAITGDHWSSRWWANQAAQAFGNAAWYYAGAGPVPPLTTATGDPLPIGAIWFDTSVPPGSVKIWNGNAWVAGVAAALPPNSVATGNIQDGAVTLAKLAPNSVDSSKIVDGSIQTIDLADGSCTLAKLAANSVDSSKIVDGSIALGDLGPNSVDASKIVDGSVGLAELAPNSVNSSKIVDGSIDPVDLSAATLALINANPFDQSLNKADPVQHASLKLGGITALFPMIKPVGPQLHARLADDSGFADFFAKGALLTGNSGIGRAPEAWAAGNNVLAIGTCASFFGGVGNTGAYIGSNIWYDGANWKLITAGGASMNGSGGGTFTWYTATAGAVGANAVLIERMRLDIEGRLGIGRIPLQSTVYNSISLGNCATIYAPAGAGGFGDIAISCNSYHDGANHIRLTANPVVAAYLTNGQASWYYAATGAAGSVAAFSERMRLDGATGSFMVNYTTPNASYNLMVGGGSYFGGTTYQLGDYTGSHITLQGAGGGWVQVTGFGMTATMDINGSVISTSGNGMTMRENTGGVILNNGATSWASASAREYKTDIQPIPGDPFAIIAAHEIALFRYLDNPTGDLRPGMFWEDAAANYPWASFHRLPSQQTDVWKNELTDEEIITVQDIEEHKSVALELYVPLLMLAMQRVDQRLKAGGL